MTLLNQLDDETIKTIKASVDFLAQHGTDITRLFYVKLFNAHPNLKNIFNMTNQENDEQQQVLASAVYGFANNIDDLNQFSEQLRRISHKHCSLNIQAEDYPIVGENLLAAIHEIISKNVDEENANVITSAWEKAYFVFSQLLILNEKQLYHDSAAVAGGWTGLREFRLVKRENESHNIVSLYLTPVDNIPLPRFKPGQYISVYFNPDDSDYQQVRQYSLSNLHCTEFYRITVKRHGIVSNYIHDKLNVGDIISITPPAGDFTLQEQSSNPVVLLSAGVGITPMISLLGSILEKRSNQKITFIHATTNSKYHAFKQYINNKSSQNNSFDNIVFYESPLSIDKVQDDFHYEGLIDLEKIKGRVDNKETDYYLCGPVSFLTLAHKEITSWGVSDNKINYEIFGARKELY